MNGDKRKPGCVIDCRTSTRKQKNEGESLEVQVGICRRIAQDRGWSIREEWALDFSGRTDVMVFREQLEFIDANPRLVQNYLFRAIDRFTRGGSLRYEQMREELARRGVQMVDSYGIIQPPTNTLEDLGFEYDWSLLRPSEITEVVLATTAKQEITTILTRMIGQEIRLTQQGFKVRRATDGFQNKKIEVGTKKKVIEVPDQERAKYYITMFEDRAAGILTDKEIVHKVNAMGYRSRIFRRWDKKHENIVGQIGGNLLTVKWFQQIICRPIYCGVKVEKWTKRLPVKAQYPGLVSIDTFNRANRGKVFIREGADGSLVMLYDYYPERKIERKTRYNPDFLYKNVILCPECNKPFTASWSRSKSGKRVPYYHCERGHRRVGLRRNDLDTSVTKFITSLRFKPEVIRSMRAVFLDRYRERQSEVIEEASQIGHSVADLEARKAQAVRSYIAATSEFLKSEIEKQVEVLAMEIGNAQTVRNTLEVTERDIERFVRRVERIMEHPCELLLKPENMRQQASQFSLVFETLPTSKEMLSGTPKLSWLFEVSSKSETPEELSVRLRGIAWNTIECTVVQWNEVLS
jgi:site-specific DNA recombinase